MILIEILSWIVLACIPIGLLFMLIYSGCYIMAVVFGIFLLVAIYASLFGKGGDGKGGYGMYSGYTLPGGN